MTPDIINNITKALISLNDYESIERPDGDENGYDDECKTEEIIHLLHEALEIIVYEDEHLLFLIDPPSSDECYFCKSHLNTPTFVSPQVSEIEYKRVFMDIPCCEKCMSKENITHLPFPYGPWA